MKVMRAITSSKNRISNFSSMTEIHYHDLEVLLNGLNRYPTRNQLSDLANQIRFRESHITGEVNEYVDIEDLCQILENWSIWLQMIEPKPESPEPKSVSEMADNTEPRTYTKSPLSVHFNDPLIETISDNLADDKGPFQTFWKQFFESVNACHQSECVKFCNR